MISGDSGTARATDVLNLEVTKRKRMARLANLMAMRDEAALEDEEKESMV